MAFSEKLKHEVRMKSDGRCAVCRSPFVEIHHIISQKDNGPDTFDNAVALCPNCHNLFGPNPNLKKQLKEIRNSWYEIVEAMKTPKIIEKHHYYEKVKVIHTKKAKTKNEKMIAIYHVVYENETFEDAAKDLFNLTKNVVEKYSGKPRALYLDIDGHRLKDGAFDHDMWELQFYFIIQNLLHYYKEIHIPLATLHNPYEQIEEPLDGELVIFNEDNIPQGFKGKEGELIKYSLIEEEQK